MAFILKEDPLTIGMIERNMEGKYAEIFEEIPESKVPEKYKSALQNLGGVGNVVNDYYRSNTSDILKKTDTKSLYLTHFTWGVNHNLYLNVLRHLEKSEINCDDKYQYNLDGLYYFRIEFQLSLTEYQKNEIVEKYGVLGNDKKKRFKKPDINTLIKVIKEFDLKIFINDDLPCFSKNENSNFYGRDSIGINPFKK